MTYDPPAIVEPRHVEAFARISGFDANRFVYHYTRWERLLDIAHSRALRLTPITQMNDPRESKRWIMSHSTWGTSPSAPPEARTTWKHAEEFRGHVKVAGFATDVEGATAADRLFNAGYGRPRMWAQYSANHTGACVVFERGKLVERLEELGRSDGARFTRITHEVMRYGQSDPLPAGVQLGNLGAPNAPTIGEVIAEFFFKHWSEAFYFKHEDWRDEREYRIAVYDPTNAEPYDVDIRGAVAALVLGVDFKEQHLPVARSFSDALGIDGRVAQINWNRLSHQLLPVARLDEGWVVSRFTGAVTANLHLHVGAAREEHARGE